MIERGENYEVVNRSPHQGLGNSREKNRELLHREHEMEQCSESGSFRLECEQHCRQFELEQWGAPTGKQQQTERAKSPMPLGKNSKESLRRAADKQTSGANPRSNTTAPTRHRKTQKELQAEITIENISSYGNGLMAHANAKKGKGHYAQIKEFEKDTPGNVHAICSKFADGSYKTGPYRLSVVNDSGKPRIVGKVAYPDRVAQWMIALYYTPYYLGQLHPNTHAAIPGRGIHTALRQTEELVRIKKYTHCIKLDVHKYFPSIHRETLKIQMEHDFKDQKVLSIVQGIIDDAPMDGIPIGNYFSQFLANRYLTGFDFWLGKRADFVRYMDDIIVFGNSREDLMKLYREIEWKLKRDLFLDVKDNWQIFKISDRGIDFVGYRVWQDKTILRKSTFGNLRKKTNRIRTELKNGATFTDHKRSVIMSYLGWASCCSTAARTTIYNNYFRDIIEMAGVKLTKKMRKAYEL